MRPIISDFHTPGKRRRDKLRNTDENFHNKFIDLIHPGAKIFPRVGAYRAPYLRIKGKKISFSDSPAGTLKIGPTPARGRTGSVVERLKCAVAAAQGAFNAMLLLYRFSMYLPGLAEAVPR